MQLKKIVLLGLLGVSCLLRPIVVNASPNDGYVTREEEVNEGSDDAIGNMLLQSISLMGIPYKWGGNTPQTGLDCSGYIKYVYQKSLGITLPRTAAEMAKVGKKVSINELEPGDLLFFNTSRGRNTHVGMYIGNNKFIQSPRTGDVIRVTELNSSWRSKFNGAKRIVQENVDENGQVTIENYRYINDEALPAGSHRVSTKHKAVSHRKGSKKAVATSRSSTKKTTTKKSGSAKSKKSKSKKKQGH